MIIEVVFVPSRREYGFNQIRSEVRPLVKLWMLSKLKIKEKDIVAYACRNRTKIVTSQPCCTYKKKFEVFTLRKHYYISVTLLFMWTGTNYQDLFLFFRLLFSSKTKTNRSLSSNSTVITFFYILLYMSAKFSDTGNWYLYI